MQLMKDNAEYDDKDRHILTYNIVEHLKAQGFDKVEAEVTCTLSPLQIDGKIDDIPFYFRDRWGGWYCSIGVHPLAVSESNFTRQGIGNLSIEEACNILVQVFTEYLNL